MKSLFKFFILATMIFLFAVILGSTIYRVPVKNLPAYILKTCPRPAKISANDFRFVFDNGDGGYTLAGCVDVQIFSEDYICVSSPCPEFTTVFRGRTARDGSLDVPKRIISNSWISYVEVPAERTIKNERKYQFVVKQKQEFGAAYFRGELEYQEIPKMWSQNKEVIVNVAKVSSASAGR